MRRLVAILFLIVLMGVFATGCANITGNEFIGNWVNNDRASESLEIKRNGENFIVSQSAPTVIGKIVNNGEKKTTEFPAVFKESLLTVNKGSETITISYVKEGDYLLVGGHKFIKQK